MNEDQVERRGILAKITHNIGTIGDDDLAHKNFFKKNPTVGFTKCGEGVSLRE